MSASSAEASEPTSSFFTSNNQGVHEADRPDSQQSVRPASNRILVGLKQSMSINRALSNGTGLISGLQQNLGPAVDKTHTWLFRYN